MPACTQTPSLPARFFSLCENQPLTSQSICGIALRHVQEHYSLTPAGPWEAGGQIGGACQSIPLPPLDINWRAAVALFCNNRGALTHFTFFAK